MGMEVSSTFCPLPPLHLPACCALLANGIWVAAGGWQENRKTVRVREVRGQNVQKTELLSFLATSFLAT